MKREARIARLEALPGGGLLLIVFRGGWIDGLSSLPAGRGKGEIARWLDGSRYVEEMRGVSLGDGAGAAAGDEVRSWAAARGLPVVALGDRNARQARVIAEGFAGLLEGKG